MLYRSFNVYENNLDGPFFFPKVGVNMDIVDSPEGFHKLERRGYSGFELMKGGLPRLERKTGNGSIAFCIFVEKELAHITWASLNERSRNKVDRMPVPIDWDIEVWTGSSRTIPKYRRKGLYLYAYSEIFKHSKTIGKLRNKFTIEKKNKDSHKALIKHNSKVIGSGYHISFIWDIWITIVKGDIQINVYRNRN